jgi:hypothetical protein
MSHDPTDLCGLLQGLKKTLMALLCERTIRTERPPSVGEVRIEGVAWSAQRICYRDSFTFYFFYKLCHTLSILMLTSHCRGLDSIPGQPKRNLLWSD